MKYIYNKTKRIMKNIMIVISIFALFSCTKEQQIEPQNKTHQLEFKSEKLESGVYPSYRIIDIPCAFTVEGSCTQTLTVDGDSLTIQWNNETIPAKCLLSDEIDYTIISDITTYGGGTHRTVIEYTMSGIFQNDSLIQTGICDYKYYFNGQLSKQCGGEVKKLVCGTTHF